MKKILFLIFLIYFGQISAQEGVLQKQPWGFENIILGNRGPSLGTAFLQNDYLLPGAEIPQSEYSALLNKYPMHTIFMTPYDVGPVMRSPALSSGQYLYTLRNVEAEIDLPSLPPNKQHKVARIIYHLGHWWEGTIRGTWKMLDNVYQYDLFTVPTEVYLPSNAGTYDFHLFRIVNAESIWSNTAYGVTFGTFTPAVNVPHQVLTFTYPANNTGAIRTQTIRFSAYYYYYDCNCYQTKDAYITFNQSPYPAGIVYSNISDVYGNEQSGNIPAYYKNKVNPGPERFFLWANSNYKFRIRINYNNAAPSGGYANTDAANGNYDYEYNPQYNIWAYEYRLQENRTGADRSVGLEISVQKPDGSWGAWEDANMKNTDNSVITQGYIHNFAQRKWNKRYLGASEDAQDIAYVYPDSYYSTQFGTEAADISDASPLVTNYSEPAYASGWELPADSDLQDLKSAGFVPNRPFVYNGTTLGTEVSPNSTYNNWSASRTTFLDNTVSTLKKIGYGNAFYLYDKAQERILFPENGVNEASSNNEANNVSRTPGVHLVGNETSPGGNTYNSYTIDSYNNYIFCTINGTSHKTPQLHFTDGSSSSSYSARHNGVVVKSTIGTLQNNLSGSTASSSTQNTETRTCTPNYPCPYNGAVIGPFTPFSCSGWTFGGSIFSSNTRTYNWTYRAVHD